MGGFRLGISLWELVFRVLIFGSLEGVVLEAVEVTETGIKINSSLVSHNQLSLKTDSKNSNMKPTAFFSSRANGKLLLTAEYFILDGAVGLALPTQRGQNLEVFATDEPHIIWQSLDADGSLWFEGKFEATTGRYLAGSDGTVGSTLANIFTAILSQRPDFTLALKPCKVIASLDFPRNWGLGSSSTLIFNLAQWAKVNPYQLQFDTFGGSGYDIACAGATQAILYQKLSPPQVQVVDFEPSFKHQLFFVYLQQKQNSRLGIARYRAHAADSLAGVAQATELTNSILKASDLVSFEAILLEHEQLVARTLDLECAKDLYFKDYWGVIKSLGAWGGDFVLVTSDKSRLQTAQYFNDKGYTVFLDYDKLILQGD